jgi:hypothetical protein
MALQEQAVVEAVRPQTTSVLVVPVVEVLAAVVLAFRFPARRIRVAAVVEVALQERLSQHHLHFQPSALAVLVDPASSLSGIRYELRTHLESG